MYCYFHLSFKQVDKGVLDYEIVLSVKVTLPWSSKPLFTCACVPAWTSDPHLFLGLGFVDKSMTRIPWVYVRMCNRPCENGVILHQFTNYLRFHRQNPWWRKQRLSSKRCILTPVAHGRYPGKVSIYSVTLKASILPWIMSDCPWFLQ